MNRELLSKAFGDIDESFVTEAYRPVPGEASGSPERIVPMKKKRIISAAAAAALLLALGISAYAVFGLRSVGSHAMPETGEYTDLSELRQVEQTVGYPVTLPDRFTDGYAFSRLTVRGEAVFDETGRAEREFYGVHAVYARPGSPDRYLDLNPVLGEAQPEPTELRTIDGVRVRLNLDHYKTVPEEYQETEEDLAGEAAGHFYISFGADNVAEYDIASAGFELDGAEYMLMDMDASADTLEELARMAAEVIAVAKG